MTTPEPAAPTPAQTRESLSWLVYGAWGLIALLGGTVATDVTAAVTRELNPQADLLGAANAAGRTLAVHMATLFIISALVDFAGFFTRCADGQPFTQRNARTLRSGGEGLIWAAGASALFSPTLVAWIDGDHGGVQLAVNDLALGVGAMGAALLGVALVWNQAVRIRQENDEIV